MIDFNAIKELLGVCGYKDIAVYMCLLSFGGRGKCFPSRKSIAKRLKVKSPVSVSESLRRLEKKGFIKREINRGRSTDYRLLSTNERNSLQGNNNAIEKKCDENPTGNRHFFHQTPAWNSHTHPDEKTIIPNFKNATREPANIGDNDSGKILKGNIKGNGIGDQNICNNTLNQTMHEFMQYFEELYARKTGDANNQCRNAKNLRLILELLQRGYTLETLKKKCDIFFTREGVWARDSNYTIPAFASENIFNTLFYSKKEKSGAGLSNYPRVTKENLYEFFGVEKDEK